MGKDFNSKVMQKHAKICDEYAEILLKELSARGVDTPIPEKESHQLEDGNFSGGQLASMDVNLFVDEGGNKLEGFPLFLRSYGSVSDSQKKVKRAEVIITTTFEYKIDELLCIGCGKCIELCEGEAPNEFDKGLSMRKAVYIPNNQSLPRIPYIDLEHCENPEALVKACPVNAIDLEMKPFKQTLKIGTVIVATGFDMFDPTGMYMYGEKKDVVTQLELARLLDMSGPTAGNLRKISDHEKPEKLVMIQCVGSREPRIHEYCSRICCGIAMKHALDIKKRWPDIDITILHKDIRLNGKDYERFYYEAEERGVKIVRGEADKVTEVSGGLVFHYKDEDNKGDSRTSRGHTWR